MAVTVVTAMKCEGEESKKKVQTIYIWTQEEKLGPNRRMFLKEGTQKYMLHSETNTGGVLVSKYQPRRVQTGNRS